MKMMAAAGLMLVLLSGCAATRESAGDATTPAGWRAENVEVVGYSDLGGHEGALKLAIRRVGEGEEERWYLYVGHLWESGWSIVDVTDPAAPRYVRFIEGPPNTTTKQVTLHGNLLITGLSPQGADEDGDEDASVRGESGVYLWDVSDPENPQRLSHWSAGPGLGTHRNSYPGGDYAYISTRVPGYRNLVLVILDVSDPRNPRQVGLWAQPGQRLDEPLPQYSQWLGYHGPLTVAADGRTAVGGYAPLGGEVFLNKRLLSGLSRHEVSKAIAYVPQAHNAHFPFTVSEMVLMGRVGRASVFVSPSAADHAAARAAMEQLRIRSLAESLYTQISGGERQLVLIARALAQGAPCLILDEPTANLDLGNQARVIEEIVALKKAGFSILFSSHDPNHAFLCADRVALMSCGIIIQGGAPQDVMTSAALTALYETRVDVSFDQAAGRLVGLLTASCAAASA